MKPDEERAQRTVDSITGRKFPIDEIRFRGDGKYRMAIDLIEQSTLVLSMDAFSSDKFFVKGRSLFETLRKYNAPLSVAVQRFCPVKSKLLSISVWGCPSEPVAAP